MHPIMTVTLLQKGSVLEALDQTSMYQCQLAWKCKFTSQMHKFLVRSLDMLWNTGFPTVEQSERGHHEGYQHNCIIVGEETVRGACECQFPTAG